MHALIGLQIVIKLQCVLVAQLVQLSLFVSVDGVQVKYLENKNQLVEIWFSSEKTQLYNCVGGGSSSFGFWNEFMDYDKQCEFIMRSGQQKVKYAAPPLIDQNWNFSWCSSIC